MISTNYTAAATSVTSALELINKDISINVGIKLLAKHSGTNECTLKKIFRKTLNISIYQYLLQCRMTRAKELLKNTGIKEKDIAMECGYCSLAGFVTSFKKYHGMTPGELRKQSWQHGNH